MNNITETDRRHIAQVQSILVNIDKGNVICFNVAQYEKKGLITVKKVWGKNAVGNRVQMGTTFHLTEKGQKFLNLSV